MQEVGDLPVFAGFCAVLYEVCEIYLPVYELVPQEYAV